MSDKAFKWDKNIPAAFIKIPDPADDILRLLTLDEHNPLHFAHKAKGFEQLNRAATEIIKANKGVFRAALSSIFTGRYGVFTVGVEDRRINRVDPQNTTAVQGLVRLNFENGERGSFPHFGIVGSGMVPIAKGNALVGYSPSEHGENYNEQITIVSINGANLAIVDKTEIPDGDLFDLQDVQLKHYPHGTMITVRPDQEILIPMEIGDISGIVGSQRSEISTELNVSDAILQVEYVN